MLALFAAQMRRAKTPDGGGGGLTTTPSYIGSGTKGEGTTGADPEFGTNAAGDLFAMRVYVRSQTVAMSALTGWTQQGAFTIGAATHYLLTRDARSTGGESGTVAISVTGNCVMAKIDTYRNVALTDFIEDITTGGSGSNDPTVDAPQVDAGGTHRLACAAGASIDDSSTVPSFTGESGGNWTLANSDTTTVGGDGAMWLQTAALDAGGTISGGGATFDNAAEEHWAQHGFALVGV